MRFSPLEGPHVKKPLVPALPIGIETGESSLEWIGELDTGSPRTLIAAEVLPDPSTFRDLPLVERGGYSLNDQIGTGEIRRFDCRAAFGGIRFADHLLVMEPRPPGVPPFWLALLGTTDFLSTFTITFEYHKTPPVFHVKHPNAKLDSAPDPAEALRQIDGVGPQWRSRRRVSA